jgi:hypothetical protein
MSYLSALSLKELLQLRQKVENAIFSIEAKQRAAAIAALREIARAAGFTLAELVAYRQALSHKSPGKSSGHQPRTASVVAST